MVVRAKKIALIVGTSLSLAGFIASCGKKSSDDDESTDDSTTVAGSGSTVTASNALAAVYPQTLALAIFPQSSGTSLTLLEETVSDPNAKKNVDDKIKENEKRLKGEIDCFDPNQFKPMKPSNSVTCYEFDVDMNPSTFTDNGMTRSFGTTDGKVSGTVGGTDTTNNEACMVAFARSQVEDSVQQVDRALAMVSGMLCQAKKEGLATDLPANAGDTLDLSTAFGKGNAGLTGATAKITRLADVDGNPVYRSDIEATGPDGKKMTVNLVHSPGANDTSKGTMSFSRPMNAGAGTTDPNNSANKTMALSINYSREVDDAGAKRMRFEVRRAAIENSITPFDSSGLVNYAAIPQEASNSQVHAINYVAFDINPDTNAGNLSYWQNPGGSYNESARGFLFNISKNNDVLSGCGISGATANVSIRKAILEPTDTNVLKPVRYWHPRENQNTNANKDSRYSANEGFSITQQCFTQDSSTGVYNIDTVNTSDSRGYSVLATTATNVTPPQRPKAELKGDFRP